MNYRYFILLFLMLGCELVVSGGHDSLNKRPRFIQVKSLIYDSDGGPLHTRAFDCYEMDRKSKEIVCRQGSYFQRTPKGIIARYQELSYGEYFLGRYASRGKDVIAGWWHTVK